MDATTEPETIVPVVFGRSSKKRKAYRQRGGDEAAAPETTEPPLPASTTTAADPETARPHTRPADSETVEKNEKKKLDDDGEQGAEGDREANGGDDGDGDDDDEDDGDAVRVAVAELMRRRKQRRQKIGGVEFRDDGGPGSSADRSLVPSRYGDLDMDDMDFDFSEPLNMGMRFAPQTGLIGDVVNKHMEEYVEAQLAKRQQAESAAKAGGAARGPGRPGPGGAGPGPATAGGASATAGLSAEAREQLAMKGKLHEIDLGTEARQRNIAMTQRATQQLHGTARQDQQAAGSAAAAPGSQPRLGRDGKPRSRKRRGSDDVERDQIVEQFLHENKMDVDVYDVSQDAGPAAEGRPTDDRIAEQFRRDFMEAVALRMRRKRKPLGPPAKPKTRNEEEILKGPKLGGSRNVRSVMRDKLLQKQEEQRQNIPKYEQELQEQRRRQNRRR